MLWASWKALISVLFLVASKGSKESISHSTWYFVVQKTIHEMFWYGVKSDTNFVDKMRADDKLR